MRTMTAACLVVATCRCPGAEKAPLSSGYCSSCCCSGPLACLINAAAAAPDEPLSVPRSGTELSPGPPSSSRTAGDAGVLRSLGRQRLELRGWSRGCCSLYLHLETCFRSSWRQSRADSHDRTQSPFLFFTDRTDKQIKKDPDSPQLSSEDFGRWSLCKFSVDEGNPSVCYYWSWSPWLNFNTSEISSHSHSIQL